MTCIIGLEHKGHVYMGADSAISNASMITTHHDAIKVFRAGPFLIGAAGSHRANQLLRYHLPDVVVQQNKDDLAYIVRQFVDPVRTMFKEYGQARIDNNAESSNWCYLVLGYKSRVYEVQNDYSVVDGANGLVCIGSGSHFAYGAMAALAELPPKKRIKRALEVAAQYDPHVCGPFIIRRM